VTGTRLQQVTIADLRVAELAGRPMTYRYDLDLLEHQEPAEETITIEVEIEIRVEAAAVIAERVDDVADGLGALEVRVEMAEGEDWSAVAVLVEGTDEAGTAFSLLIEEQTDGLFTALGVRAQSYTARAVPR
jgi:hypothetical protein